MDFSYKFPVVRGVQAKREYYIAMIPLQTIPKLFPANEEYVAPEFRAQRRLNESRVPVIEKYILENRDNYVFSALAASIDGDYSFVADSDNPNAGILEVSMNSRFLINDGQHRKAAIEEALKEDNSLANETIPVVFYADKGLARSQQIFTDLNKNAVKTSNSLSELYDSRDPLAVVNRNVIKNNLFLNTYIDKEKDNLGKYSSKLFTLHNFYLSNKAILGTKRVKEGDEEFLTMYWKTVVDNMRPWQELINGEIRKSTLRKDYIASQGVVIQSLGRLGNYFLGKPEATVKKKLTLLSKINWSRSNPEWYMRAINNNGKIITSQHGIALITNELKKKIGIKLNKDEEALEKRHHFELQMQQESKK